MRGDLNRKSGAALIEACLVIIMLCLILFGILQLSLLIGARDVVTYAAVGSARSASVGSGNDKLWQVAFMLTIPTAGPMLTPSMEGSGANISGATQGAMWDHAVEGSPGNQQYWAERFLIPYFLGADSRGESRAILNYANWEQGATRVQSPELSASDRADAGAFVDSPVEVSQLVPLSMPFARVFYRQNMHSLWRNGGDQYAVPHIEFRETAAVENHAAYYMERE